MSETLVGRRIKLLRYGPSPLDVKIKPGYLGTITRILPADEFGWLEVRWDIGATGTLIPGYDQYEILANGGEGA